MPQGKLRFTLALSTLFAIATTASAQSKTWEFAGNGQWPQVSSAGTAQPTTQRSPVPELDRIAQLIEAGRNTTARKRAVDWLLQHKSHAQRDRALYLTAQAFYGEGSRIKSFYYCDELLDEYPDSDFYYPAIELQYRIADRFLMGYKRKFLGMPMFHAYDEAIEMLYRIQNRSPGSPLAERSLLRTADFYFANRDYDFAADTYAAYVRSYPRSPEVPRCRLREALAHYAQFRGPRFDATQIIDAREQLRSLVATNRALAEENNVPSLLEQIDRDLARKLYITADFYRRTKEPRGAAYTYRYLMRAFPQAPEAKQAQLALASLPTWAQQAAPEPAIMPEFAPGTPPTDMPGMIPSRTPVRK